MFEKTYLGDSVYAEFDGYNIVLTTEDGDDPSNIIYMEPEVVTSLLRYIDRLKVALANEGKNGTI
jgi:hypothetical protein